MGPGCVAELRSVRAPADTTGVSLCRPTLVTNHPCGSLFTKRTHHALGVAMHSRPTSKVSSEVETRSKRRACDFPSQNTAQLNITDIIGRW